MSKATTAADIRLYFGALDVLILEVGALERDILQQVLTGFKVKTANKFSSPDDALGHLQRRPVDLMIVGAVEGAMDAYAFVDAVRRQPSTSVRAMPIILMTGHCQHANILRARDCGANFVVAKPITPDVLYGRIAWLARDPRPFIQSDGYCGPDRRFQSLGPPAGLNGRRSTDLSLQLGESNAPNMSQQDIDAMLSGKGLVR